MNREFEKALEAIIIIVALVLVFWGIRGCQDWNFKMEQLKRERPLNPAVEDNKGG